MMPKISIHDNVVTGYTVLCDKRELVLHTEFREKEPKEVTDVVFRGVEAYHISGDNMESILFDVAQCEIEEILQAFCSEFEEGREYIWPGLWNESPEACREYLEKQGCRGWKISPSYGMGGFVIAKSMELRSECGL